MNAEQVFTRTAAFGIPVVPRKSSCSDAIGLLAPFHTQTDQKLCAVLSQNQRTAGVGREMIKSNFLLKHFLYNRSHRKRADRS